MARKKAAQPADAPRPHDQREAQRFTLILRAGKLITARGEFLVVLRDLSSGGIRVRFFHPLDNPGPCEIELASGARYPLECAWQANDQAGFRFVDRPVDIHELLEEAGPFPKRSIRLRLACPLPLKLHSADRVHEARLRDLSQHGAAIESAAGLAIGQRIELVAGLLGPIAAQVRWRRGLIYGLVFQQGFRLDELARLAAVLQSEPTSPAKRRKKQAN